MNLSASLLHRWQPYPDSEPDARFDALLWRKHGRAAQRLVSLTARRSTAARSANHHLTLQPCVVSLCHVDQKDWSACATRLGLVASREEVGWA